MEIQRESYLAKLISRMWNGQVKVITGIRRSGKSYLLKTIFRRYLLENDASPDDILTLELDELRFSAYRNPITLGEHVREWMRSATGRRYLFIDEIQMCGEVPNPAMPDGAKITFYDALNEFRAMENLDVYVTGSNSKMLSKDIRTEFRGRGDEVRVHPLSFSEYFNAVGGDKAEAFDAYMRYGGMPFAATIPDDAGKEEYLKGDKCFDEFAKLEELTFEDDFCQYLIGKYAKLSRLYLDDSEEYSKEYGDENPSILCFTDMQMKSKGNALGKEVVLK